MNPVDSEILVPHVETSGDYVLPQPPRAAGEVVVLADPAAPAAAHRRAGEVARSLGERFAASAASQRQLLGELRATLTELDTAVPEAARARLKALVHTGLQVLDWCDAVQDDLGSESSRAARGLAPIDLASFCSDVAVAQLAPVSVVGATIRPWWGDGALLAEVVTVGIAVAAERIGGGGAVLVEVGERDGGHWLRVVGRGEPVDDLDPATIRAFRIAVERLGATVAPDALGPGGTGFVVSLPVAMD